MTTRPDETNGAEDAEFERWLLRSAESDDLAPAAPAFAKFAASLGDVSLQPSSPDSPSSSVLSRGGRGAITWFGFGALGGSAVTALLFAFARSEAPNQRAGEAPAPGHSVVSSGAVSAAPPVQVPSRPLQEPQALQTPRIASPSRVAPRGVERGVPAGTSRAVSTPAAARSAQPYASSTLLAEVAMLDAVRAKLSLSDALGALRLLESYGRQFPQGQLARDAAVLSIEALAAAGNPGEARRRATLFLQRSPDDPHAARVRRVLGDE